MTDPAVIILENALGPNAKSYDPRDLPPYYDDVDLHAMRVLCQRCGEPLNADAGEIVTLNGTHLIVDACCIKESDEWA